MLFRPNPASGVPIYLQLMEQVKHGIETGALRPGEQLPGIRPLAEELGVSPGDTITLYLQKASAVPRESMNAEICDAQKSTRA